jgi:transposase
VFLPFYSTIKEQLMPPASHQRGPVQEVKNKLQKWCELVDVDEFRTSKLCCHCHCEMAKVKFNGKETNSVLRCSNNECGITIDRDINGARNIFMLLEKMILKHSAVRK